MVVHVIGLYVLRRLVLENAFNTIEFAAWS